MNDVNLRIAPSLCALYLDVCMYVFLYACMLHARKTRAPHVGWQIGEDKRRTRTGDKRNIIRWTRLGENYFENVIHEIRENDDEYRTVPRQHLSNKTAYNICNNSNNKCKIQ